MKKRLVDHLGEVRKRVLVFLVPFILISFIAFFISDLIINKLKADLIPEYDLVALNIFEGFLMRVDVSILFGFILTFPILLYEIFMFISPALKKKEKNFALIIIPSSLALFILGALFSYKFLFKKVIEILLSMALSMDINQYIPLENFINVLVLTCLSVGVVFQYPLVLILLIKSEMLDVKTLVEYRKYIYLLILVLTGIITPDPTPVSQIILTIPMIALLEICIFFGQKRKK